MGIWVLSLVSNDAISDEQRISQEACAFKLTLTDIRSFKMATAFNPGGQSPPSLSRTLDKTLDEAQYSGEINLSARKLKEYPKAASKYDIADTSVVGM